MLFLHEQGGGRCISPGLSDLDSPFVLKSLNTYWNPCPHQLPEALDEPAFSHPMIEAMGPKQTGQVFWVRPADAHWIWKLSTMTHPAQRNVAPFWTAREVSRLHLELTDAAPFCLIDIDVKNLSDVERVLELPRLRNLVLSGPVRLPNTELLSSHGLPAGHNWIKEGGRQLNKYLRDSTP